MSAEFSDTDSHSDWLEPLFDVAFSAPGGVARLRQLILTMAMQGKLVPQDPQELPAAELLEQIAAERSALTNAAKIRVSSGNDPIAESEKPYTVPRSWEWVRLGELTTFSFGKTPASKNPAYWSYTKGQCWAAISDLPARGYISETKKRVTEAAVVDTFTMPPVPSGTLLMSFKLSIGKTAIATTPMYHNEAIVAFRNLVPELKMYLYWTLSGLANVAEKKSAIKGDTLNSASLSRLLVPLPPLEEQKRIVARIVQLMMRCDELESQRGAQESKRREARAASVRQWLAGDDAAAALLGENFSALASTREDVSELRKAILQLAVTGRLVVQDPAETPASELLQQISTEKAALVLAGRIRTPKALSPVMDSEEPYVIPQSWKWVRLGDVSLSSDSGWSPQCHSEARAGDGWGVLKVSAVSWGKFDPDENKALPSGQQPKPGLEVQVGDFLISRANTEELVARSVIVEDAPKHLMMSDKIVRFSLSGYVSHQYINLANGASEARKYYIRNASGTSSSMKNVSREAMANLPIPLPPAEEQRRIVSRVDTLMRLCDTLEQGIDAAQAKQAELLVAVMARV